MNWNEILEELSALEHEQWKHWSKSIIGQFLDDANGNAFIIRNRVIMKHQIWLPMWKPYDELSEKLKGYDRVWGRKVLVIFQKHFKQEFEKHGN